MSNKKSIGIVVLMAILSLVIGVGSAQAADLSFPNDTNVSIGGHNYTITPGSVATTSLILTANTLIITVPPGASSFFTIQSPDGYALGSTGNLPQSCSGIVNVLTIGAGLGPIVITPNPASAVCAGGSVAVGSGGLTSGGGTTTTTTPPSTITITSVTPSNTTIPGCNDGKNGFSTVSGVSCVNNLYINTTFIPGCNGTLGFSTVTGQSCVNNFSTTTTTTPPTTSGPTSYNFGTVTLENGSTGNAVMELQRFLNNKLMLGLKLDGILGPKTIAVIKKWQKDHGLVADGLVGAKTKAMMQTAAESGN
jgi:hypothetical protein